MRKEYNNRWDAPLVNPGFTIDDSGVKHEIQAAPPKPGKTDVENLLERGYHSNPRTLFIPTIDGRAVEAS